MDKIVLLNGVNDIEKTCVLLHESFKTIADEYHLTKDNSPTHNAFLTTDQLLDSINKGLILFGLYENDLLIGCVGITKASNATCYYIEKLCVLPAYRHCRYGKMLLNYAVKEIAMRNCNTISIGIINENEQLKKWYIEQGFSEYKVSKFDNQLFTVCFLTMNIITLQKVSDEYITTISHWLNKDYVIKWFSDPDEWINEIRNRHGLYLFIHHLVVLHNNKPIGFCQYYTIDDSNEDVYKEFVQKNAYSIDYLIGEEEFLGKGFGKIIIQELCLKVFNEHNGSIIVVKPEAENLQSCKSLLSVGFVFDSQTGVYMKRNIRLTTVST